jgi:hypothetical protein
MKKFLALAAMLAIGSVQAEELKFGDLNYFLKQGQFNVREDFVVHNETMRAAKSIDVDVDGYIFQTHLGYALLDNLNLTLAFDYTMEGETEVDNDSSNVNGFNNPSIGANYRLMNQNTSGFNLDFGAVATVKIIDREVNGGSTEGNMFSPVFSKYGDPRNTLDLNARFGKKWNEANEFYLLGGVLYHMDGEYDQKGSGGQDGIDVDSSMDYKLGANYQYRPVHEFMINLGLSAISYSEYDIDGEEVSDHIDYLFNFDAKYLVNETTIAKFLFTKGRNDNFTADGVKFDKRDSLQYGLGVDLLF